MIVNFFIYYIIYQKFFFLICIRQVRQWFDLIKYVYRVSIDCRLLSRPSNSISELETLTESLTERVFMKIDRSSKDT